MCACVILTIKSPGVSTEKTRQVPEVVSEKWEWYESHIKQINPLKGVCVHVCVNVQTIETWSVKVRTCTLICV